MVVVRSSNTAKQHIAFMDGLRGIAVLMVVLYHMKEARAIDFGLYWNGHGVNINAIAASGFMGVEVFFFISGFVLFYPYARYLFEDKALQTVAQFANRRALKILPSYIVSLGIITFLLVVFLPKPPADVWRNLLAHLFFVHSLSKEWFFALNGPLWSLAVEVQFYLIFPLVCWAFRRWALATPLVMMATAAIYRFYLHAHGFSGDSFYVYQLPGFLDIFALGMASSYLVVMFRSQYPQLSRHAIGFTGVSFAAAALVYGMLWWLSGVGGGPPTWDWQNASRTVFGAALALFAVAGMLGVPAWQRVIANPFFVFVAFISYNLYLWNKFVIVSLGPWLGSLPPSKFSPQISSVVPLACVAVVAIAATYLVERPFLDHGWAAFSLPVKWARSAVAALKSKRPAPAKAP